MSRCQIDRNAYITQHTNCVDNFPEEFGDGSSIREPATLEARFNASRDIRRIFQLMPEGVRVELASVNGLNPFYQVRDLEMRRYKIEIHGDMVKARIMDPEECLKSFNDALNSAGRSVSGDSLMKPDERILALLDFDL
ncbi:uncharacterized protein LOC142339777 [Convolutriloba macropyga]|uniref:uncharacterized protein LOC142339777 n=1 Tax=Convolutriloba macropyga TaxID=536237 RepID=UPI003F5285E0